MFPEEYSIFELVSTCDGMDFEEEIILLKEQVEILEDKVEELENSETKVVI